MLKSCRIRAFILFLFEFDTKYRSSPAIRREEEEEALPQSFEENFNVVRTNPFQY